MKSGNRSPAVQLMIWEVVALNGNTVSIYLLTGLPVSSLCFGWLPYPLKINNNYYYYYNYNYYSVHFIELQ